MSSMVTSWRIGRTTGVAVAPAETERQPYDEFDKKVVRETQGSLPIVQEPFAPAAKALGISQEALLEHLEGLGVIHLVVLLAPAAHDGVPGGDHQVPHLLPVRDALREGGGGQAD